MTEIALTLFLFGLGAFLGVLVFGYGWDWVVDKWRRRGR